MTKNTKLIIGIVTTLILIPILVIVLAVSFVNPNQYKGKLTELVSSKINRTVEITGNLEWSIFPLGITINGLKVANDPKFTDKYILTSEVTTVSLKFLPLLYKTYSVDYLYLKDTTISLAKDSSGNSNWQSMSQGDVKNDVTDAKLETKPKEIVEENKDSKLSVPGLSIDKIKIENGTLNWTDAQKDNNIQIDHANISSNDFTLANDSPFRVQGSFRTKLSNQNTTIYSDVDSYVTLQQNLQQINLDLRKFNIELGGKAYPRHPHVNINSKINFDRTRNYFKISNLQGDLNNISLSGNLEGELNDIANNINGEIKIDESNLEDFFHGLNYQHSKANYKTIAGKFTFKTTNQQILLSPLQVKLDDDRIDGDVKINYSNKSYNIVSTLNSKRLNLDKLIPAGKETNKETVTTESTETNASPTGKREPNAKKAESDGFLANINLTATNSIDTLVIKNETISNVKNTSKLNQGKLNTSTKFNAYEGTAVAETDINLNSANPTISGNFNINNLNLGKLLKEQANNDKLSGITDFNINYNTRGNSKDELIANLNGNLKINITKGMIKGVDLNKMVSLLTTKISVNPKDIISTAASTLTFTMSVLETIVQTTTGDNQATPITSLTATATINNGVFTNDDMKLVSDNSEVLGSGTLDLPREKIKYTIKVQDIPKTGNITTITFPITFKGNMYKPHYSLGAPTGTLVNDTVKSVTKVLKKVPILNKLPIEQIDKLPLEEIDKLLHF